MPQISKLIRQAVYNRLSDATLGFNAKLNAALAGYIGIDESLITIPDWTPGNPHFLFGRISPDDIEESDLVTYPLLTIDTAGAANTGRIVSAVFAGPVQVIVSLHISWLNDGLIPDFASYADWAQDAMFECLNSTTNVLRSGGTLPAYQTTGDLAERRGPIQISKGDNWRQTIEYVLTLQATSG